MIVNIILLLIFSISLIPENIGFNFTFELRSLIFAIGVITLVLFSAGNKIIINLTNFNIIRTNKICENS